MMKRKKIIDTIKFEACEHLDFDDNYSAKKCFIKLGETKVCWDRPVIDSSYPTLVQFCKLRGRMNSPEMCTSEENKQCSVYKKFEHEVPLDTIDA